MTHQDLDTRVSSPACRWRVGTSGYSYAEWIDAGFYPPGTKAADYLPHYAAEFDCVETDSTYYGIPKPETVRAWARRTPDGFTMAAKFPKTICHAGERAQPNPELLLDVDRTAADRNEFLTAMSGDEKTALYGELAERVASGELTADVEAVYPIEEIREALEHAARAGRDGKVLVTPNGPVSR